MAHNDEAGGSGGGGYELRSTQLTYGEADVLYWQRVPVPPRFKLPHGWHLGHNGYAVPPPPPPGPETRALIYERRARMSPAERALPDNALNAAAGWKRRFEQERSDEIARMPGNNAGKYNNRGRHDWWSGRDVDAVLAYYGYRPSEPGKRVPLYYPQASCMAPPVPPLKRPPPRAAARTAAAKKVKEEAPSLPHARRHKKVKAEVKKEAVADAPPREKLWWEVEAEVFAAAAAATGRKEEFPGEHIARNRSVDEDYRQVTLDDRQAQLWSAMDSGAIVDLAGPSELPPPKEEEDEEESFNFSSTDDDDGGDGDDGESLDWSGFELRRR